MNQSNSAYQTTTWQVDHAIATLSSPLLRGAVDSSDLARGIGKLIWCDNPLNGFLLGVTAEATSGSRTGVPSHDFFSRGSDLIVVFEDSAAQPFSWQMYWRVLPWKEQGVLLDGILSFQTDLLESFPQLTTESKLETEQVMIVAADGRTSPHDEQHSTPNGSPDCVLCRPQAGNWSYAEMTHPDDLGTWQVLPAGQGETTIRRHLGGNFLEKGVIRRLRVRGAFLPRENDVELAVTCQKEFAAEQPPLTA